jgi:hypothetical protein
MKIRTRIPHCEVGDSCSLIRLDRLSTVSACRRSNQEGCIGQDITHREVSQTDQASLHDRQRHRLILPANQVRQRSPLVCPNDRLDQLLPVATPANQEHEARCPDQVPEQEHPRPDRQIIHAIRVIAVDQLRRVEP